MRREGSVGRLLTSAFTGLVALVVGCGAVELTAVLVEHHAERQLVAEVHPLQVANAELRTVLSEAQAGLRGYSLTGDERMLDTYEVARSEYGLVGDELVRLGTDRDAAVAAAQIDQADGWWAIAELQRRAAPGSEEAAGYAEQGEPLFRAFVAANDELRISAEERAADLGDRAEALRWVTIGVISLLTVVAAALAVLTAIRTRRRIVEPLTAVVTEAQRRATAGASSASGGAATGVARDSAAGGGAEGVGAAAGGTADAVGADRGRHGPAEIRAIAEALDAAAERTEEMRRNEELVVARLHEIDTVKTDFMSTVSHELRTPLTSISGYVELMRDAEPGQLTASQERMLDVIARNARRLRDLIEDILTLSRIESGDFRTLRGPLDLAEVVLRAVASVEPTAAKNFVGLHAEVRGPVPVRGDSAQLDRVLDNLLSNAVKFTPPEGTVTVTAERRGDHAVLVIADTGMGIPEDEREALFGRFFRASNAIRQAVPGTGLGLAIVHTILGNHEGTIEVRSTENVGTTVTVKLPADELVPVLSGTSRDGSGREA
ncbi:ATP-binding protein [Actinoplanes sp. CA-131856]